MISEIFSLCDFFPINSLRNISCKGSGKKEVDMFWQPHIDMAWLQLLLPEIQSFLFPAAATSPDTNDTSEECEQHQGKVGISSQNVKIQDFLISFFNWPLTLFSL